MAITSEIIGKLGGTDVEVIPASGSASGGGNSELVLATIEVPEGETRVAAAVGVAEGNGNNRNYFSDLILGDSVVAFTSGTVGISAVLTSTSDFKIRRERSYGSDSFDGNVYIVKM